MIKAPPTQVAAADHTRQSTHKSHIHDTSYYFCKSKQILFHLKKTKQNVFEVSTKLLITHFYVNSPVMVKTPTAKVTLRLAKKETSTCPPADFFSIFLDFKKAQIPILSTNK